MEQNTEGARVISTQAPVALLVTALSLAQGTLLCTVM